MTPGFAVGLDIVAEQFGREVDALATVVVTAEPGRTSPSVRAWWPSRAAGDALVSQLDVFLRQVSTDGVDALLPAWTPAPPARLRYMLGAPIAGAAFSDGARGAVCAGLERRPADPDRMIAAARGHAQLAAAGLDNEQELARLAHLARHDGLTGCLNRGAIRDVLIAEIERCQRHGHELSCCFVDVDHFKAINDERGHLAGDRVLAAIGRALRLNVRPYDQVARPGGDEFVVVMPETDRATALEVARRLSAAITEVGAGMDPPIQASVGVAAWHPGLNSDDLLDAADREVRLAKQRLTGTARVRTGRR